MKQWICALAVCGCGLLGAQASELRQTTSRAMEDALGHFQEAGTPIAVGLGGAAMTLIGWDEEKTVSAGWSDLQDGCLVPETGAFASLLSFVRGAAIRAQTAHEKEALLRMFSLLILIMLLGVTAAICLEPTQGRRLEFR